MLWLVARRGVAVIVGGIAIGTIAAFSTSRLLTEVLFGLSPGDPRVYATAAALLFATGVAAALRPAARALRIHPIRALGTE